MILFIAIAHSIQIFRNANYQDRESSLFNRNACAPQFELSVPQSSQTYQRLVTQRLVNMCILSLITQQLLLMTPPGLHTNHLISNYCSEKLISYLIFLFSFLYCVFAISWTFKKSSKNENLIKMMDLLEQKSRYLLNIFFDLGFLLVIFWRDTWEIKPFQHKHFQLNTIFS